MAYTVPRTWVANSTAITASALNTDLRDNLIYLQDRADNPPYCRVFHSLTQSIANDTIALVTFDSEVEDTHALHSTTVNPQRMTIPTGQSGHYLVSAYVEFAPHTTGVRRLTIQHEGVDPVASLTLPALASPFGVRLSVAFVYRALQSTYFDLAVYQNSGGALNLLAYPSFAIQRVS